MAEKDKKTILCSVLFLDILEYSRRSVLGQIALKEKFNTFLQIAVNTIPTEDRIILDTTDGAAISFLGEVGDALKVALSMRKSLLAAGQGEDISLLVRMGINLGPIRLVRDNNGLPNIVGDGINVAHRVMGFSNPGQILVSRAYFDAISRVSKSYTAMFHYQGAKTDKHVREHDVYAIGYGEELSAKGYDPDVTQVRIQGLTQPGWGFRYRQASRKVDEWVLAARIAYGQASTQQRVFYMGALAVVLGIMLAIFVMLISNIAQPPALPLADISNLKGLAGQEMAVSGAQSPVVHSAAGREKLSGQQGKVQENKHKSEPDHKILARTRSLEETTAINSGDPAVVTISVLPWGEVYLDGRMQGVSPPLAELQVVPGKHEIEIRNTSFPSYKKTFLIDSSGTLKIKHKFGD